MAYDGNVAKDFYKIIEKKLEGGGSSVSLENGLHFKNDLGFDSLDLVEVVMKAEERFDFDIPDEDAAELTTIGEAVNYIRQRV